MLGDEDGSRASRGCHSAGAFPPLANPSSWRLHPHLSRKLRPVTITHTTMFSTTRRRCARSLLAASPQTTESIPLFLVPAFQYPVGARGFASTAPCQSKIGSAPLSIPPGVTFKVNEPSVRGRGARTKAMSTVQIKGPLGELSMDIPAYVNINQDPALSGPTLTVEDSTDKKQKAMWGAQFRCHHQPSIGLTFVRNDSRLSPESHPRRQRRPFRDSPLQWCRLSLDRRDHRHNRRARIPWSAVRESEGRVLPPY